MRHEVTDLEQSKLHFQVGNLSIAFLSLETVHPMQVGQVLAESVLLGQEQMALCASIVDVDIEGLGSRESVMRLGLCVLESVLVSVVSRYINENENRALTSDSASCSSKETISSSAAISESAAEHRCRSKEDCIQSRSASRRLFRSWGATMPCKWQMARSNSPSMRVSMVTSRSVSRAFKKSFNQCEAQLKLRQHTTASASLTRRVGNRASASACNSN